MDDSDVTPPSCWGKARNAFRSGARRLLDVLDERPNLLAGSAIVLSIFVLSCAATFLYVDRHTRISLAEQRAASVAATIASGVGVHINIYDALLRDMVSEAENPKTPLMSANGLCVLRFGRTSSSWLLDDANIIDEQGKVAASIEREIVDKNVQVGDRDYFLALKQGTDTRLNVSRPFASRTRDGRMSIALSRRIEGENHRFEGVAMIAIGVDSLTKILDSSRSTEVESVALVGSDGTTIASAPAQVQGNAEGESDGLHAAALRSYVGIAGTSLTVAVMPSVAGTLARWRVEAIVLASVVSAFVGALLVGSLLLKGAMAERRAALAQVSALAVTDGLTGLSNRRALDERLEREWERSRRARSMLSVLFIDIDKFKLFNDAYGHATGDEVLRIVAQRIAAHARRGQDMAARYGGEEFAVVLPEVDAVGAQEVAEAIRSDIQGQKIEHAGSSTGSVTVSIGCATVVANEWDSAVSVLQSADAQLLVAKAEGRNRVRSVVLTGEPDVAETLAASDGGV